MPNPRPPGWPRRGRGPHPGGRNVYGGVALAGPLVTTLPATQITNTSAYLNGSVDPQGSSGTWWFAWGTTPQYGSNSTPVAIAATSIPQTIGHALTGLTTGTTYHFAAAAQTAAGTVYGFDGTFVAEVPPVVTNAGQPLSPFATGIAMPHLAFPFTLTKVGAVTVEQDSLEDVFSCVQAIVACPRGACPELPSFGVPDLTFGQAPLDPRPLVDVVLAQEPRAEEEAVVTMLSNGTDGSWQVALTTTAPGTDGAIS